MSKTKLGGWLAGLGIVMISVGKWLTAHPDSGAQAVGTVLILVGGLISGGGATTAAVGLRDAVSKNGKGI